MLDFPANTVRFRGWMRGLIDEAQVAHDLLDLPDAVCLARLRARNAGGGHPFQVTDAEFAQFSRNYVPPTPDEGFNVIVHAS